MNYYNEIENHIKYLEINEKTRKYESDFEKVNTYYEIGKLIVEAQGGELRAKYGNELIKEWSIKLISKYGKGYNYTNLARFRKFYINFPILATVWQLSWSHIRTLLPIKEENKRNYYINECIKRNLSVRELILEIKNETYERLIDKPDKIEIIQPKIINSNIYDLKNPIVIKIKENMVIKTESDLELAILSNLKFFFKELGHGFTFVDNQYKIVINKQNYYIDLLLFNIEFNNYVVIELKLRELRKEDKAQIEFYMNAIDKYVKKDFHNKTMGIIISKKQDKLIAEFIRKDNIIPINYLLKK